MHWLSKEEAPTTRVITVTFNLARNNEGRETRMKSYFPNAACLYHGLLLLI